MKNKMLTLLIIFSLPALGMSSQDAVLVAKERADQQADLTRQLSDVLSYELHLATQKCKKLLESGANPNGKADGIPFLSCAVHRDDASLQLHTDDTPILVQLFLEHGANIHARGPKGNTALHCAAEYTKGAPICQVLLSYGADIDAKNDDGHTALHLALFNYYSDVIKCLLNNGAHVDDLFNLCNDPRITYGKYRDIITHYRFYPLRTPQQLKESQERIFNFLLCLKRNHPQFPGDLRRLILLPYLRDDTLNCPLAICKPFVHSVAPQIVRILFGQIEAIEMLKAYRYEQVTPLIIDATQRFPLHTAGASFREKLDSQIEETIIRDLLNQENK